MSRGLLDPTADVRVIDKDVLVELEFIGEGFSGDVNWDRVPNGEDAPLCRFTVLHKVDGEWDTVDDASYCTNIDARTPVKQKRKLARIILSAVADKVRKGDRIRRHCQILSHISEDGEVD